MPPGNAIKMTCPLHGTFSGFGHLSPSTLAGRIFCVAYAAVGIPLALVFTATFGSLFAQALQSCCRTPWCRNGKWVGLIMYILLDSVFFVWIPAGVYCFHEKWEFADACYFAFVALSTIGFGDFIPGKFHPQEDVLVLGSDPTVSVPECPRFSVISKDLCI